MMEAPEFRKAFNSFVGSDRYHQFVRFLNSSGRWRGRFLFWQEELLARFAVAYPSAEVSFERVEPMLRVCELHDADLATNPTGLSRRCRGAVTDYALAAAKQFPNTDCGPVLMGRWFENFREGMWYCPACQLAETEWRTRQAEQGAAADRGNGY
jgi:hypothetical protein